MSGRARPTRRPRAHSEPARGRWPQSRQRPSIRPLFCGEPRGAAELRRHQSRFGAALPRVQIVLGHGAVFGVDARAPSDTADARSHVGLAAAVRQLEQAWRKPPAAPSCDCAGARAQEPPPVVSGWRCSAAKNQKRYLEADLMNAAYRLCRLRLLCSRSKPGSSAGDLRTSLSPCV